MYMSVLSLCRKFDKTSAELHPIPVKGEVWHTIGVVLIGPLPETPQKNKYIMIVSCLFSKWPEATALPDKTAIGVAVSEFLFHCFTRHGRFAGLGINNPTETASSSYHTSTQGTKVVVEAIKGCGEFSSACHLDAISKARHESRKALDEIAKQKLDAILATLSPGRQRAIMRVVEGKTSSWLTTLPLQSCHFDLAPVQFRDGLALRYL